MIKFLKVQLSASNKKLYTYKVPPGLEFPMGCLVVIPLGDKDELVVARVIAPDPRPTIGIKYKYIVCQVDLTKYLEATREGV